jgi:hypothetical protein
VERYNFKTHTISPEGEVILKPDYEKYINFGPTGPVACKARKENADNGTSQETEQHVAYPDDMRTRLPFDTVFPHGYEIINTLATDYLCGLYAVMSSIADQHPQLPQPSLQQLQDTLLHPKLVAQSQITGMTNLDNFLADQVGAILHY